MYIYNVVANFYDGESVSFVTIGSFTDTNLALLYKEKWEEFFLNSDLLSQPDNWDPLKDNWTKDDSNPCWADSKEFSEKFMRYELLSQFVKVEIFNLEANSEVFIENISGMCNQSMSVLIKQFDRDWKINQISSKD
jgi:hypothetical protein